MYKAGWPLIGRDSIIRSCIFLAMLPMDILKIWRFALKFHILIWKVLVRSRLKKGQSMGFPLEFGHSLQDRLGGQLQAGFVISGLYEDRNLHEDCAISEYMPVLWQRWLRR